MNNFRPRLYHIKTEKALWKYFEQHAGYNSEMDIYQCAGIVDSDTRQLWLKLVKEWQKDKRDFVKKELRSER